MSDYVKQVLDEALWLASLGFRVHPVHGITEDGLCTCGKKASCPAAGKHPVLSGFLEKATTDPEQIIAWDWYKEYNLGVVPGDDFIIIDFDGPEGLKTMGEMLAWCPELEEKDFMMTETGSGGVHLIGRGKAPTAVRRFPATDIRGTGGHAVVPPSRHNSGNPYTYLHRPEELPPVFPDEVQSACRGDVIPQELLPREIVTTSDFKLLARQSGKYQDAFKAIVLGHPFAKQGERDTVLTGIIGMLSGRWPTADANQVASHFAASCAAMAMVSPDAPTVDQVAEKFARFSQADREKQHTDAARGTGILITTDVSADAQQAIDVIVASKDTALYRRACRMVDIEQDVNLPNQSPRADPPPKIRDVDVNELRGIVGNTCQFLKVNKSGGHVPAKPPTDVLSYAVAYGRWKELPYLEALTSGPVLRLDGTVFPGGGYDAETGIMSIGDPVDMPVLEVDAALAKIDESIEDFPFKTRADKAAWMAGMLTGVGCHAFTGPSPMFFIDANTRGAGKTLAATVASNYISGSGATQASLGQDNEEDRKQITSMAMGGAQIIMIDNVSGHFGTPKLCEALTLHNGVWGDRILGKNVNWSGPFRPVWWATGNNVVLAPDMARRVCYSRLRSPLERPEERSGFRHPSLITWVNDNRKVLFNAGLSLLRRYCDDGRPYNEKEMKPWGGYEEWSKLIRGCLVWCGMPDPEQTRDQLRYGDEDHDIGKRVVESLTELLEVEGKEHIRCNEIVDMLFAMGQTAAEQEQYAELRQVIDEGCPRRTGTPTPQSVGRLFRKYRGRVFGGRSLRRRGSNGRYWYVGQEDSSDKIENT
jgi:bifunctional DNA primase/polymerase-like protein